MMIRPVIAGFVSLSVLVAAAAQQESPRKASGQPDQTDRAKKLGEQNDSPQKLNDQQSSEQNQRTELPECLVQLDLTAQQKQDLLAIYRDSDMKSQQLWDRIQSLHRQAISMEAAAIAAERLEGHVHSAHQGQVGQPTHTDAAHNVKRPAIRDEKHANPAKNPKRGGEPTDERQHSEVVNNVGWQEKSGELNIVAIRVGVAQPDGRVREYLLTQPGENAPSGADQAFHSHQAQLTKIWKEIHDGHEQLVEMEATTIVNVEAQLTEPQLKKLDTTQPKASNTPNSDVSR